MFELMYVLRSLLFYIGYTLAVVVVGLVAVCVAPFVANETAYLYVNGLNYFVIWWLRICCGVKFRLKGKENIPDQPCLIVSNHQSAWETYFFGTLFQPLSPVLKSELLKIPFFGWTLRLVDPISIDRGKPAVAVKQLLSEGKKRLQRGRWVVIFPEGTRVRPGQHKDFSKGAFALAKQARVSVLPVVHNAGKCWPPGSLIKRPGIIEFEIGSVVDSHSLDRTELSEQVEAWVRHRMDSFNQ